MSDIILTAYDGAILGPIAKILGWVMNLIYSFLSGIGIGNISVSIIVFTIVIYMCLMPITYKQQKFSKMTQRMQPELQKVQKKYKDKKDAISIQAMQDETKAIYEKYGVSPSGSCIFMLINLPILLALYRVFYNIPAYIGSIKDQFMALADGIMSVTGFQEIMGEIVSEVKLSTVRVDFTATDHGVLSNYVVDTLYGMNSSGWDLLREKFSGLTDLIDSTQQGLGQINQFLGMNISDSPMSIIKSGMSEKAYLMVILALLIPIISYLTQVISIKMMSQDTNVGNDAMAGQMKMMNRIMPLFSLFFCFSVPVGLGIYWIISALVRSVQQYSLNKHFEKVDMDEVIRKNQEKEFQKARFISLRD